ncbi:UxaA family hydrolase (plasmid) [Halarchaeum sp. CBA1220]|uniref:UxaA family hydrolase n=1 Tax=Halarchaeum sp. CBA1220 TaxID=1853682 RepID=UPI000F3AA95C|nr:UxaA family hydrolase [Halarchaeum sp. CBA1220]QLC35257.1 UxaA family hydrolase [Halarchaeum sp. CBA1220]
MKGVVLDDVALLMAESDTVATAIDDLDGGRVVDDGGYHVTLAEDVPFGHKVALESMSRGDVVRKYGEAIGRATQAIEPGEWVHTHNCESARGRGDLAVRGEVDG